MVPLSNDPSTETELLDPFGFEHDEDELLRCLGYGGQKAKGRALPSEVSRIIQSGTQYLSPKAVYACFPVHQRSPTGLTLGGTRISGEVAGFLDKADRIAVFVVTAGEEISEQARTASRDGNMLAAWALDALGSYAAEATAEALSRYLRRSVGEFGSVSSRFSPGYCGMDLAQQSTVFSLVAAEKIGVRLENSMLMRPIKSVSGLLGIGDADAFNPSTSPCERCQLLRCSMRR